MGTTLDRGIIPFLRSSAGIRISRRLAIIVITLKPLNERYRLWVLKNSLFVPNGQIGGIENV